MYHRDEVGHFPSKTHTPSYQLTGEKSKILKWQIIFSTISWLCLFLAPRLSSFDLLLTSHELP